MPGFVVLEIKDIPPAGVDDVRILILVVALVGPPVGQMDVSVQEKFGFVLFHQGQEDLEALMGKVAPVVELIGGGVRHQDVETAPPPKLEFQPGDPAAHL